MNIGANLREYRKAKGLTQAELAEKAGISRSYYADIEKDYYNPSLETLKNIASALNVPPSALLGESDLLTLIAVDNDLDAAYNTFVRAKQRDAKEPSPPDTSEKRLLSLFRELNPEGRDKLLDYADDMVQSGKYIKNNPSGLVEENA